MINQRRNTIKTITPKAVVDAVEADLRSEGQSTLIRWLSIGANRLSMERYVAKMLAPTPTRGKTTLPFPPWLDSEGQEICRHNLDLIQAFSQVFAHAWPRWQAYREAMVQFVREKGLEGSYELYTSDIRRHLRKYFSGTGQFKASTFTLPKGVGYYPQLKQEDRWVLVRANKGDDSRFLLMETDGAYALGPTAEFPSTHFSGGEWVEIEDVLPSNFLPSPPSVFAQNALIRLKYLLVAGIQERQRLTTPEEITAFFEKAKSLPVPRGGGGYEVSWVFERPIEDEEGGIDPFILSYMNYRMGPMILAQQAFRQPIMGYPLDQKYVQADRPPNLKENDKIAVVMPRRLDSEELE